MGLDSDQEPTGYHTQAWGMPGPPLTLDHHSLTSSSPNQNDVPRAAVEVTSG